MEPEVREFLKRILNTMSVGLLWMIISSTAGIMFGYAFFEEKIHVGNIIFYCWILISLPLLIWYFVRVWKKPIFKKED